MSPRRIFKPRKPSAAEHRIQLMAVEAGAVVHPVVDDQNGWDCLIEFPPIETETPPDLAPPGLTLLAQVKSAEAPQTSCVINLSNGLKYAKHALPGFLVLVAPDRQGETAVYVRHVWKELIEDILGRARRAHRDGIDLHRRRMTVRFSEADRFDGKALEQMAHILDDLGPRYAVLKQELHETLGYGDVAGTGKLTFAEGVDPKTLVDLALGLVDSVPISRFTYHDARFGIALPRPDVDAGEGLISITPTPVAKCSVTIRDPESDDEINLDGEVFSPGIPYLPRDYWKLRIRTPVLEIVLPASGRGQVSSKSDLDEWRPLKELLDVTSIWAWASKGGLEMQVWAEGRLLTGSRMDMGEMADGPHWRRLHKALSAIAALAPEGRWPDGIGFTLRHLFEQLETMSEFRALLVNDGVNLNMVFEGDLPEPERIAVPIFLQLNEYLFTGIMDRPLVSMTKEGDQVTMSLGPPVMRRGAVLKGTAEEHMTFIDSNLRASREAQAPGVMMIAPPKDGAEDFGPPSN